jgi:hypothetical protein
VTSDRPHVPSFRTLLWRRTDRPGHEAARLVWHRPFWQLTGTAVWSERGMTCRVDYGVVCDPGWLTRHAWVTGWVGPRQVRVDLLVVAGQHWEIDGRPAPELAGCLDVDLGFTPATNLLPIRRLGLADGQEAAARAAWQPFPGEAVVPLDQVYRRTGPTSYHYRAGELGYDLELDADGFVRHYPGRWELESG